MKTISDFVKLKESEAAVNTVGDGNVALREVPLGAKINKRKDESAAYEGDNPLKDMIGKFPLNGDQTDPQTHTNPLADNVGKFPLSGVQAPDIDDGKSNGHMFKQKQDQYGYTG